MSIEVGTHVRVLSTASEVVKNYRGKEGRVEAVLDYLAVSIEGKHVTLWPDEVVAICPTCAEELDECLCHEKCDYCGGLVLECDCQARIDALEDERLAAERDRDQYEYWQDLAWRDQRDEWRQERERRRG